MKLLSNQSRNVLLASLLGAFLAIPGIALAESHDEAMSQGDSMSSDHMEHDAMGEDKMGSDSMAHDSMSEGNMEHDAMGEDHMGSDNMGSDDGMMMEEDDKM